MNQYQRGRRVEQEVIDFLGTRGYDCIRSAGSKGAADIVAVHDGEICFVQVKISDKARVSPAEREQLLRLASRSGSRRSGAYALIAYKVPDQADKRKRKLVFRELMGPGPRETAPWIPYGGEEKNDGRSGPVVHLAR